MHVRMRGTRVFAVVALALLVPFAIFRLTATSGHLSGRIQSAPAAHYTDAEAINHIGVYATVTGVVAGVHDSGNVLSGPAFLDFGAPYPSEPFSAVIFARNRARFGNLDALEGKTVQVTGHIDRYHDHAEMILESPGQLRTLN